MLTLVFFYVLPFNCSYECQCEWLLCPSVKYNHCNTVRKKEFIQKPPVSAALQHHVKKKCFVRVDGRIKQ